MAVFKSLSGDASDTNMDIATKRKAVADFVVAKENSTTLDLALKQSMSLIFFMPG